MLVKEIMLIGKSCICQSYVETLCVGKCRSCMLIKLRVSLHKKYIFSYNMHIPSFMLMRCS